MSGFDQLDAATGRFKMVTQLPSTPEAYYVDYGIASDEWKGGEVVYHNGSGTGADKLYIQTATSGRTATWVTITTQFTAV
jgi:hypothetical protein